MLIIKISKTKPMDPRSLSLCPGSHCRPFKRGTFWQSPSPGLCRWDTSSTRERTPCTPPGVRRGWTRCSPLYPCTLCTFAPPEASAAAPPWVALQRGGSLVEDPNTQPWRTQSQTPTVHSPHTRPQIVESHHRHHVVQYITHVYSWNTLNPTTF